jgi:CheY-like chemotaxis protein
MAEVAIADPARADAEVWKILVVDDEPAIHQVTKLALRNLSVQGRPSLLINALSAKDAREQLAKHPDVAVVLLDVVMETEDAGLEFIKHIREQVGNPLIRIILRTGQPGQAPERQVMVDYDINDYKEKTELTASKLFTTVMSSIRTFGHLQTMEAYRLAVDVLGRLNTELFAATDAAGLAQALVAQLDALALFSAVACWPATHPITPRGPGAAGLLCATAAPDQAEPLQALLQQAQATPGTLVTQGQWYAAALPLSDAPGLLLGMAATRPLPDASLRLMQHWLQSAAAALAHGATRN